MRVACGFTAGKESFQRRRSLEATALLTVLGPAQIGERWEGETVMVPILANPILSWRIP